MNILLGVGGGIAAFKAAALCSMLVQRGHDVRVAMSRDASAFVGRRTFEGLSGKSVITASTQIDPDGSSPHIEATRSAEVLVVAPATADLCARLAAGTADDAVTLAALVFTGRRVLCPAMNDTMWNNPVVQRNVGTLQGLGWEICGPTEGWLAEGYSAMGRMVEPAEILALLLGSA